MRASDLRRVSWVVAVLAAALLAGCAATSGGADPADLSGAFVDAGDGTVWFVWQGERQRVQQPGAMFEEDLAERGLVRGPAAPPRLVLGEPGSFLVMIPPDGADARLHVAVGDAVHEVQVLPVDPDRLAGIPEARTSILDRIRLPQD